MIKKFDYKFILYSIAFSLFFIFIKFHWNRRWLYYHAWKIPGPFSLPLIGSTHIFLLGDKDLYLKMLNIARTQPPVFKIWLGPILFVLTSRPQDLKIILTKCLDRGFIPKFANILVGDGILTASPTKWSTNRKIICPTFNLTILYSFISGFNKNSKKLVQKFQNYSRIDSVDIFLSVYCSVFDTFCETLLDVDASLITGQENYIKSFLKAEKISTTRGLKFWYYNDFIWKHSPNGREMEAIAKEVFGFIKKIIKIKKSDISFDENSEKGKCFLNHSLNYSKTKLDDNTILDETQTMLLAGSETQTLTICMILLILGIYPEIQEKVYNEILTVVGNSEDKITLDHINQMIYLDAVIKEVLRLFPTSPATLRETSEDIKLDDYTIPDGSLIVIPMVQVHKLPEYWENPDTFNPERFLSKEQKNLPPCVYMPFGYGRRNCIGFKYAFLSMKVMLSTLLQHYKFESVDYKSIEEIEFIYHIVIEPKKGYNLKIEERKKM